MVYSSLGCTFPRSFSVAAADVRAFIPSAVEISIKKSQLTERGNFQIHSIPGLEKDIDSLLEMLLKLQLVF